MEKSINILWVDDEIDLLKPYILFLGEKGYQVTTCTNGNDALKLFATEDFDLVFLDENMPGLSGLETLSQMKAARPFVPVVMITKSEAEDIMEEAIGSKIADYLIKPVNPNQILLSIKKNIETRRLISEKTASGYQSQFGQLSQLISSASEFKDWTEIYRKIVYWEIELQQTGDNRMDEVLNFQKVEANKAFSRYIKKNYTAWFDKNLEGRPMLSPGIMSNLVFPLLDKGEKVFFLLIDNLRYDQWKILEKQISTVCRVEEEHLYCSILPTATQYSRNALFAGLMPLEINRKYPDLWVFDEEEEGKNLNEEALFSKHLGRLGRNYRYRYEKVTTQRSGKKLIDNLSDLLQYDLNIIIYNFVDMMSHARTDVEMIRELANNEAAYRSLTSSWFEHSNLLELMRQLEGKGIKIVLTTDHGSIRVQNPVKVVGDKKTSPNLRYKLGRNLNYNPSEVFEAREPEKIHLPKANISSSFIFATESDFLVYPNNYNHFVNYYRNTLQHGGVSMEEMLIPAIILES